MQPKGYSTARSAVIGAAALAASAALGAEEKNEDTGIPDTSVAGSLPPELADPGGVRRALAVYGIQFGATYIGEVWSNSGGLQQGTRYNDLIEMDLDVSLEKMIGWKGLAFHASGFQIDGTSISSDNLGSLAAVSGIEAFRSTRLFELWFEQKLFDDKVGIKFGQIAADGEFFISANAANFIDSTYGWPTLPSDNLKFGGPIYPFLSPGVRVNIEPNDSLKFMVGVWDDNPVGNCPDTLDPGQCNKDGLNFRIDDEPLIIAEGAYSYGKGKGELPGTIKIGGWRDFGQFDDQRRDDAGNLIGVSLGDPLQHRGNYGIYGVIDQMLYRVPGEGDAKGISMFARIAGSPSDRNQVDFYADGGLVFTGFVPGRPDNVFGVAGAYTRISDDARDFDRDSGSFVLRNFEANLEVTYSAQVLPGWTIQPDFQYFWNPGGNVPADPLDPASKAVKDASVFGARTNLTY